MLGTRARQETLVLSLGQTWVAPFFAKPGTVFADGTYAECLITDPAGNVIATWEHDSITDTRIDFIVDPEQTDPIPHGSYFRVTAHYPPIGPRPWIDENLARGLVVRDDNPTPLAGPRTTNIALSFADSMDGPDVDPNWVKVGGWGRVKIWDNHLLSLPNGMGGEFALFAQSAVRYRAQTNQDSVKAEVTTLTAGFTGTGRTTVIVSSNQAMTSWVGFQFQGDSIPTNRKLNIVRGTSPIAYVIEQSVSNVVADNGRYTLIYDSLADRYLAYKETDFSAPLASWLDGGHVVPHGNGYRYPALLFESFLITAGIQLTGWSIKDN